MGEDAKDDPEGEVDDIGDEAEAGGENEEREHDQLPRDARRGCSVGGFGFLAVDGV